MKAKIQSVSKEVSTFIVCLSLCSLQMSLCVLRNPPWSSFPLPPLTVPGEFHHHLMWLRPSYPWVWLAHVYFNPTLDWALDPNSPFLDASTCKTADICKPIGPQMGSDPPVLQTCLPVLMIWVCPHPHLWILPRRVLPGLPLPFHVHCHYPSSGSTTSCKVLP